MTLKTAASLITVASGSGLGQMSGKNSLGWGSSEYFTSVRLACALA